MNEKERMKKLIKIINDASEVYYNTGEEKMPNIEYDKLYDELEALEKSRGGSHGIGKIASNAASDIYIVFC